MPHNYCHHINPAGVFCGGPPMKHRDYCFWHLHENGRRMTAARARARSERVIFKLPVLDDPYAVQVGVMQLADAIAHREIDHRHGRLLLSALRLAAANLKAIHNWYAASDAKTFGTGSRIVMEDPTFEEQYGLPKDFDLGADPEVAFPVPRVRDLPLSANLGDGLSRAEAGRILRDAQTPIPGTDFQVTADDMELMEVYEREGEQAGLKRAAVLERNRKRREARERRMHYEQVARNRNIQLAAGRLAAEQRKAETATAQAADSRPLEHNDVDLNRKPPQSEGATLIDQHTAVAGGCKSNVF